MANFNFNKVILGGRLTSDPELKTTESGVSVTSFRMAVNRRGKSGESQTDFFSVTAWRGTAEFVTKYFHKSSCICIIGSLQNREWTDKEGNKRTVTEIVADEANFVDSKSDSGTNVGTSYNPCQTPAAGAPKFEELDESEPLPF